MGTGENDFAVKPSGSMMTKNGTISNKAYYDTTALLSPLFVPSIAAPQPRHNPVVHPLMQKYASYYYNTLAPQSNITAGFSSTTHGVEGNMFSWKDGVAIGVKNGNNQNVEPVRNRLNLFAETNMIIGHKHLPDRCAEKVEDDLREVPLKKRIFSRTIAGANANNHGTKQEASNLDDSNNSNIRLEPMVVANNAVRDVSMLSAQTGGGGVEMDEAEMKRERQKIKHRETARKSRMVTKKRCKVLEAVAQQLTREISELSRMVDFYSRESVKIQRQNEAILEELRAGCSPEEFSVLSAENPFQQTKSQSESPSSNDEGGYASEGKVGPK